MVRHLKVGMIFECGPQGADKRVCEDFAKRLIPSAQKGLTVEVESATSLNKKTMLDDVGRNAKTLLRNGCGHVVVVWDLYPPWTAKTKPCRRNDTDAIWASLEKEGVGREKVFLVCIEAELEAWLLSAHQALKGFIKKKKGVHAHKCKVPRTTNPEALPNPKQHLQKIFQNNALGEYSDLSHAHRIAAFVTDISELKKCASFQRFVFKVAGIQI